MPKLHIPHEVKTNPLTVLSSFIFVTKSPMGLSAFLFVKLHEPQPAWIMLKEKVTTNRIFVRSFIIYILLEDG
jgi:hypothetical protein